MNKQRGKDRAPEQCDCRACRNLRDECGDKNYPFLSKRLLIRGWAGVMTSAEKAYRRAHSADAQALAARSVGNAELLRSMSKSARKHVVRQGQLPLMVQETG